MTQATLTQAKGKGHVLSVNENVAATIISETSDVTKELCLNRLPENYSSTDLVSDWNLKFPVNVPNHWAMMTTSAGVYFSRVADVNQSIINVCSILVRSDMSVEVNAENNIVT